MKKENAQTISIEDFEIDGDLIEGEILLEEWNTFFNNNSSIYVTVQLEEDTILEELLPEHLNGYEYVVQNQSKMLDAILNELLKQYPKLQAQYGYDEEEKVEYMPDVSYIQDFSALLSPSTIFILDVSKGGFPYIGCLFSCKWDEEHAFGAMMYKDRVVEIGGADTAFLSWIAQDDLDKCMEKEREE